MSESARKFYDRISDAYDLIADAGEHRARERGLELLAAQPGESILEIGFGTGHSLAELAKAVGPQGHISGVDISQGMRDVAHRHLEQAGCAELVELVVAEVPPLPFDDHRFDAITMSFTLELFPPETIGAVIQECRRVLKPTGRLGVVSMATVDNGDPKSVLERTYIWMHEHFPHIVDCQPIPLEQIIRDAGLRLIEHERISLFTMPVAIIVAAT
ncbi:MAG: methyltransferase domain-containing protein [Planctomycetales bacterium]|nr:methyltransferase domain-containing protein [Planctomycetales bacterium]